MVIISFLLDIALINLAEICGFITRFGLPLPQAELFHYKSIWFLITLIRIWALYSNKVYDKRIRSFFSISSSIIQASVISTVFIFAVTFFSRSLAYPRLVTLFSLVYIILFLTIKHYLFWKFYTMSKNKKKKVLIVGATDIGKQLIKDSLMFKHNLWDLTGFLDNKGKAGKKIINSYKLLGPFSSLANIVKKYHINLIIIALPTPAIEDKLKIMTECEALNIEYFIIPNFYEIVTGRAKMDEFEDLPILEPAKQPISLINSVVKRFIDIILSFILLVISLPFSIFIILLIKLDSKGRVIYKQLRAGKHGKPFSMYKFRTMVENADKTGPKLTLKKDKRITFFGNFLRRWSLDEIPQFLNVLKGDMSLVGPRPEIIDIVKKYKSWQRRVLDVKPGLTGFSQIRGRQELDIDPKLKLDLYYINNYSLLLDFEIIFKTGITVLSGKGVH